jgi:hypothetical protein
MNDEKELWENRNKGEVWPLVYDVRGNLVPTRVGPGQKIHLTAVERRINQERAYGPDGDLFKNGALSAVKVFDTAEDYEEIKTNSNTKSEAEIAELLKLTAPKLKKELETITSPFVMERLKELTEDEDSDLTVAKVSAIKARYDEVVAKKTGKVFDDWQKEGVKKTIEL